MIYKFTLAKLNYACHKHNIKITVYNISESDLKAEL